MDQDIVNHQRPILYLPVLLNSNLGSNRKLVNKFESNKT